jgi:hypothetical protein
MHRRVRIRHLLVGLIGLAGLVITTGAPAGAAGPTVLVRGLTSPKGLTVDGNGNPVVSQGAFGAPGITLRYFASGPKAGTLQGLSVPQSTAGIAWAHTNDSFWTLGTYFRALLRDEVKQAPSVIGRLAAFANGHPDPYDQEGIPNESNPFAIASEPNGNALVADAAANSVVRITKTGQMSLVARLAPELVKTDHLPPDQRPPGLPAEIMAEPVATSVAVAADGTTYIGELKGFPFRPGTSRIWKVAPGTTNAVCSANPAIPASKCTLYKGGLTSIAALAVAPDQSAVYALEFAAGGVGEFEACLGAPVPCPPAVLLQLKNGQVNELAHGQLSEPGSLAISGHTLYVTDHTFRPRGGRLLAINV